MKRTIYILMILIPFTISGYGQSNKSKVEIYLLHQFVQPDKDSKKFWVDKTDLENTPIIQDNEIWGYDTLNYEISIDTTACIKIRELKPSLPIGVQFALTIDDKPILTGYFWNPVSSFSCDWYLIPNICGGKLKIYKSLPEHLNKDLPELRNAPLLIEAITETNRIMNLDYSKVKCSMPTISTDKINYLINDIMVNNISYLRIDSSKIENIVVIKDNKQQNIYGNSTGTVKITIEKKYFSNLKLREFLSTEILLNTLIVYEIEPKENLDSQILETKIEDYKEMKFDIENNKVILINKE